MEIGRSESTPAEENARQLANAFASERVQKVVDDILSELIDGDTENLKWSESGVNRLIGQIVATAYFKGYMDRHRGEKLKRLYL